MRLLHFALGLGLFLPHLAFAQVQQLTLEPYFVHGSEPYSTPFGDISLDGYTTWRIYAEMTHPQDFLSAVYGENGADTYLTPSGTVFQSQVGGGLSSDINCSFYALDPTLVYDSFLTIDLIDSCSPGTITAVGGNDDDPNFVDTFEATGGFLLSGITGGLWFTLNDENQVGTAGDDLRVLLAQITTNATFCGQFNIQTFVEGNTMDAALTVHTFCSAGCTDPSACNFVSEDLEDDGSCCYSNCGCTDPAATNYDATATCPMNAVCTYPISGGVFDDSNENGFWDEGETALPYRTVTIEGAGITLVTDNNGVFEAAVPAGEYNVSIGPDELYPFHTTPTSYPFSVPFDAMGSFNFGLSFDEPEIGICVDFYPNNIPFLCNWPVNHNICFRNMSNVPISGVVEVEYDPIYQGYQAVTAVDSVVGNSVYMGYDNLMPGEMFFYDIILVSPTVDYIGEYATSYARVFALINNESVAMMEEELTVEIACAYDPNDKQVFPNGFTDDHLILNDTELEYLIRFQNTGNAPAQNILLRDTLDANLDLSTFKLMANSHNVQTTLDETTREVTFFFPDIQLPDSTCCEPESHGLVSFTIEPLPDLPSGTVLNNTTYIYFDNNEPIITNTTWNTIHDCPLEINLSAGLIVDCPGSATEISTDYNFDIPWESHFEWKIGEAIVGTDPTLVLSPTYTTDETLWLTLNDPLCESYGQETFSFDLDFNWTTCSGDLDCNTEVDAFDILAFLSEYNCNGAACRYDLDGDAAVSGSDLLVVLAEYGQLCAE